jgi:hypothetical protein
MHGTMHSILLPTHSLVCAGVVLTSTLLQRLPTGAGVRIWPRLRAVPLPLCTGGGGAARAGGEGGSYPPPSHVIIIISLTCRIPTAVENFKPWLGLRLAGGWALRLRPACCLLLLPAAAAASASLPEVHVEHSWSQHRTNRKNN